MSYPKYDPKHDKEDIAKGYYRITTAYKKILDIYKKNKSVVNANIISLSSHSALRISTHLHRDRGEDFTS